jgi:hypothetical protein
MNFESFLPRHRDVFDAPSLETAILHNSWLCDSQATMANQISLSKRIYGNKVAEPMYDACKLLAMVQKDTSFTNEGRYVAVSVTPTAGVSPNFADALAAQAASGTVRFFVTRKKEYAVWGLQNDAIEGLKNDAILNLVKHELDMARRAFSTSMAQRIMGHAGGTTFQLATTTVLSTAVATLTNRTDLYAVEKNKQFEFSLVNGSSPTASRDVDLLGGANPVFLTVNSVNRDAGQVTFNNVLNTVPGITTSAFGFVRGSYSRAASGVQGWNPIATPTVGDSFMGLDRSADDVQRVSGVRVSGLGKTMLDTIEDAGAEAKLNGLTGEKVLIVNPLDMAKLRKEISGAGQINMADLSGGDKGFKYSFKAVRIDSQIGELTLLPEVYVPRGYAWLLDTSQIYLRSTDTVPKDISGSGGLLTDYTDDARQGRLGAYFNFFFENPGAHVIISWNA